jgi:uncharacterized protein (TIGR03382 family)
MKIGLTVLFAASIVALFASDALALPGCESGDEPGCGGCACEQCVCEMDSFCCEVVWDGICVSECEESCGGCVELLNCDDGDCNPDEFENCTSCPEDCACADDESCYQNACCATNCADDSACQADGCGGLCPCADDSAVCFEDGCCLPSCEGKTCGGDGCGSTCGDCQEGEYCTEEFACAPIPPCAVKQPLHCDDVLELDTADGINAVEKYDCAGWTESGPELGFSFDTDVEDFVIVTIESEGSLDHDLFLLEGTCLPDNCTEYGSSSIEFNPVPGNHYFLVVDGYGGDVGSLTMTVWCQSSCVTSCEGKVCGDDGCGGSCGECGGLCLDGILCLDTPGCTSSGSAGCDGCPCEECVCELDAFCCQVAWDSWCALECHEECDGCLDLENCGDANCVVEDSETCQTCPEDCACGDDESCYQNACCGTNCKEGAGCQDDGCGGICPCADDAAICFEDGCCLPDCDGKMCGSDGCGGTCGDCQEDEYCTEESSCAPIPPCEVKQPLHCDDVLELDTADGINSVESYGCIGWNEGGPELGFSFDAEVEDHVVVSIESEGFMDHDLFLLKGTCLPGNCVDYGSSSVEFYPLPGSHYFLVVDGYDGDVGPLTLSVWCQSTCVPTCDDVGTCLTDGCGGVCPCLGEGETCFWGECCVANCEGVECGDDSCGGSCGTCEDGLGCKDGTCTEVTGPSECLGSSIPSSEECMDLTYEGCCDELGRVLWCDNGKLYCIDCPNLGPSCGWQGEFYDCGTDGSPDPSGTFPIECTSCDPPCGAGEKCVAGECQVCVPACDGKNCGADGCGGQCGECPDGLVCQEGLCGVMGCEELAKPGCGGCPCETCVCEMDPYCCESVWDVTCASECIDQCGGCPEPDPFCGDLICVGNEDCDSCPKDCGCEDGLVCDGGDCVDCVPACDGLDCGDNGCGGSCGECAEEEECLNGLCAGPCDPDCTDKVCGDDGCAGSCGDCAAGEGCIDGACEIVPPCGNGSVDDGEECETDADCGGGAICTDCVCIIGCAPDCTGKDCGDDGCSGSCGDCAAGQGCEEFICQSTDQPDSIAGDVIGADSSAGEDSLVGDVSDAVDASGEEPKEKSGGCSTTAAEDATPLLLLAMAILMMLVWRRRSGA